MSSLPRERSLFDTKCKDFLTTSSCNKAYSNFDGHASFLMAINITAGQISHVLPTWLLVFITMKCKVAILVVPCF
jgi:urease accessory protein UreH